MITAPIQLASRNTSFEGGPVTYDQDQFPSIDVVYRSGTPLTEYGELTSPFDILSLTSRLHPLMRPYNWQPEFETETVTPDSQCAVRIKGAAHIAGLVITETFQGLAQQVNNFNANSLGKTLGIIADEGDSTPYDFTYATSEVDERTLKSLKDYQRLYAAFQTHSPVTPRGVGQFLKSTTLITRSLLGFGEPEPVKVRIETCKREYEIELALGKAAVGRQLSWQLQSDRKTKRKLRRLRPVPPAQSARNILDRIDASKREIIQNGKHFATSSPAASDSLEVAE